MSVGGGSQFDVQVRLSTVGQDQLSSGLKDVSVTANSMAAALGNAEAGTRKLSATIRQTDADGNKLSVTVRQLAESKQKYTPIVDQLSGALMKLGAAWASLSVVKDVVGDIFAATKGHEDMVTTMAATMTATNSWSDSVGIATGQLAKLKETAALVNGTEDQMVGTFTMLKRVFGGTSDQAVDLTGKLALLARQSGASVDELSTRLAAASITGKLQMRGPAGIALTGAGVDPQVLMTMKEAGQAMEYLNATIADNPGLVDRLKEGWSYLTAEFKKNKEEALETIGQGLEPLKQSLKELNATLSSDQSQQDFDKLGQNLGVLTTQLRGLFAPGGMQESEHWYTDFLDKTIAFFSTLILVWKVGMDSVGNAAAAGWDVITHPMKYVGAGGGDAMKAELTRILDEQLAIFKNAAAKAKEIWSTATASGGTGDTGPTHHTPAETPTKPAPGRGPDLNKIAEDNFKAANAIADAWDKAYLETLDGVDKQVAAVDMATQKEIESFASAGHSWAQIEDFMVAATAEGEAKKTALIAAAAEKNAKELALNADWYRGEQEKLNDELAAVTLDYYTKQQAAIDKQIDKEQELLDRRLDDGKLEQEEYDKLVGKLQTVYDAKTHLLDQEANSIVGFRKRMEEAAAAVVMTTDSISGGLQAGWDTILAHVQSTTESVRDAVVGIWGAMSTAFETGFYDVLSGKLSDLGNVLKSLWDSIPKDFSKMLAQMLERWLLTGDAMGSGQGGSGVGGVFSKLLGGGGSNAVYTPGGTGAHTGPYGETNQGGIPGLQGGAPLSGGVQSSGMGNLGIYGAAAYGVYTAISAATASHQTSVPTYQGQSLGQTADFGGPGGGAVFGAAGTVLAASVAAGVAIAAASAALAATAVTTAAVVAAVPVVGWIAAAVLLVVAAILTIFDSATEGHIYIKIQDAFQASGAKTAVGTFVSQVIDSTANFVGELALKAAGPESVQKYVTAYQTAFKETYGRAIFDIAAGSKDDLQKDVQAFFDTVLPKMAMQAAFGQTGYQPPGDRDKPGGIPGINYDLHNPALMNEGSRDWVQKQLYDPNAPIPAMLAGIGFTADAIAEIATKLSTTPDIKQFAKWLQDLVGIMVDVGNLAMKFGWTRDQWYAFVRSDAAKQGTSAQFTDQIANFQIGVELLATVFGDDRVAAGKQLVTDGQTILQNEQAALTSILTFIDQIASQLASTVQTYQSKLLSPAENEAALRARATVDYGAIAEAANPKDVAAAWSKVLGDMTALLDIIVARIQAIQALQQSYADFRTSMATASGPQFATDPNAWLAQNQAQINAIDWSDPIKGAQTLLDLEKTRYQNLFTMLQNIDAAIKSIDAASQSAIQNLQMQAMGSVVNGTWTPDVHAQGEYLNKQYQALMGQLSTATTPEQITALMGQINSIISQLASQPQDAAHYAESRAILIKMQKDAQAAADALLATMHTAVTTDLSHIGDTLTIGEKALAKALKDAQWDFTQALHNLGLASDLATKSLNGFADDLVTQMGLLVIAINSWIALFTTSPGGVAAPNPGATAGPDVWEDDPSNPTLEVCTSGPHKGDTRIKHSKPASSTYTVPPTSPSASTYTAPPINVSVVVNSGSPEETAQAVADIVYPEVLARMKQNNVEVVRAIRNNPALLGARSA